jgi:hypothetical protein
MVIFDNIWRKRAEAAEAALLEANARIDNLKKHSYLVGITRNSRVNRWTFIREGDVFTIETIGSWDDNVESWQKDLL